MMYAFIYKYLPDNISRSSDFLNKRNSVAIILCMYKRYERKKRKEFPVLIFYRYYQ